MRCLLVEVHGVPRAAEIPGRGGHAGQAHFHKPPDRPLKRPRFCVQYDAHVDPAQPVQRAAWATGELDVQINDNGEWLGRVREKNGPVPGPGPGSDLRPAPCKGRETSFRRADKLPCVRCKIGSRTSP